MSNKKNPYTWEDIAPTAVSMESGIFELSQSDREEMALEWNKNYEAEVARKDALKAAEANRASAKVKLNNLGLTINEIKDTFNI